jgi:hypothetical protein
MVRGHSRRERRKETRLVQGLALSSVCEVVCASYGIDGAELRRCGSRHPARAALAYVARRYTTATNHELAALLGLARPECVPNLTRRFKEWLSSDIGTRQERAGLEAQLEDCTAVEKTTN